MDTKYLEDKWQTINYSSMSDFEFIRIDTVCIPELNIGLNSELNRCLILELPEINNVDFQPKIKQNLTIDFFKDTNYIVIQLTDNNFHDLFNDLIISLYQRIKLMTDVDEYSKELILTFYKWSEFFEDKISDRLSENQIKGLFGELIVLRSLVFDTSSSKVNDVLNSWKGPYDLGHDFVLDQKDIEVKTKINSKTDIGISSEYQLENDFAKELELLVISVENDFVEGFSIKDLIFEIKNQVIEMLGDSSIILKAISQKGLSLKNIHQYDNYRFKPISQVIYKCSGFFPKLIRSNIPLEISNVKYKVKLNTLDEFIISKKDF